MKLNDTKPKASLVIILCLLVAMFGGMLLVAGTDTFRSRLFLLAVPEPKEQEEFQLYIYSGLSLTFDLSKWTIGRAEHGKWLESTAIADCRIGERGPSSTPPDLEPIRLGEISYDRFEYLNQQHDQVWSVHYARDGFENPAPDYTPMIIVSAPEATIDQCRTAAEDVLKTLH